MDNIELNLKRLNEIEKDIYSLKENYPKSITRIKNEQYRTKIKNSCYKHG